LKRTTDEDRDMMGRKELEKKKRLEREARKKGLTGTWGRIKRGNKKDSGFRSAIMAGKFPVEKKKKN